MAAGDVAVQVVDLNTTDIDTAITSLRVTANDKWMITAIPDLPGQVVIAHIEEA